MRRRSSWEWLPILPWLVCPLAGQCVLGQNTVVGSMTLLLALRGNIATRSMSGPLFALQLHRTTVWCGATGAQKRHEYVRISHPLQNQFHDTRRCSAMPVLSHVHQLFNADQCQASIHTL